MALSLVWNASGPQWMEFDSPVFRGYMAIRSMLDIMAAMPGKSPEIMAKKILDNKAYLPVFIRDWSNPEYEMSEVEKLAFQMILDRESRWILDSASKAGGS